MSDSLLQSVRELASSSGGIFSPDCANATFIAPMSGFAPNAGVADKYLFVLMLGSMSSSTTTTAYLTDSDGSANYYVFFKASTFKSPVSVVVGYYVKDGVSNFVWATIYSNATPTITNGSLNGSCSIAYRSDYYIKLYGGSNRYGSILVIPRPCNPLHYFDLQMVILSFLFQFRAFKKRNVEIKRKEV